ncbi:unnamed protein product [Brassica oleracea var. botrytis]|uniref:(rape) hypothetical protein n=1 Tax=Brassica napus TaxID=3708 RepID=A0A816RJM2_BRANA|nr:unnamed protein product [Brassica napus]
MCDDGTSLLQGRTAEPVRRQTHRMAGIGEVHGADDVDGFDLLLVGELGHAREPKQQWQIFSFFATVVTHVLIIHAFTQDS